MNYHPDSVAVFLTGRFVGTTLPERTAEQYRAAAGDAMFSAAGQHLPANTSCSHLKHVLIELKQ